MAVVVVIFSRVYIKIEWDCGLACTHFIQLVVLFLFLLFLLSCAKREGVYCANTNPKLMVNETRGHVLNINKRKKSSLVT